MEFTVGVTVLGVRPSKAGKGSTTRGLGVKARKLGIILGAVKASRVLGGREELCPMSYVPGR